MRANPFTRTSTRQHNSKTPTLRWTVHSPKRGWYLRLRTPSFAPGAFVALKPAEPGSDVVLGTLTFGCQTFVFDYADLVVATPRSSISSNPPLRLPLPPPVDASSSSSTTRTNLPPLAPPTTEADIAAKSIELANSSAQARYSYPPTPSVENQSTGLLSVPSNSPQPQATPRPAPPPMQITHFVLTPTSRHRVRHHGAGATSDVASTSHVPSLLTKILPSVLHEPKANSYTSAFELDVQPPIKPPAEQAGAGAVPVAPSATSTTADVLG